MQKYDLKLFFAFLKTAAILMMALDAEAALWDARTGFNVRTHPVGAQAVGSLGVNYLLWNEAKEEAAPSNNKNAWKYGYARAALNLATSAVVNRAGFEVQVFPISILGFSAGYDWGIRNFTPKWGVDCGRYECNGRIDRRYLKANLFAGYQKLVFAGVVRYEELRAFHTPKPFFDEVTLLVGQTRGEQMLTLNPALLYTINEKWKAGAASLYSRAIDTGGFSHLYGPVAAYSPQSRFTAVVGVGLNGSPVVQSAFTAFAVLSYTFKPSLSIADLNLRSDSGLRSNSSLRTNSSLRPIRDASESQGL